jgi:hypothetical protein
MATNTSHELSMAFFPAGANCLYRVMGDICELMSWLALARGVLSPLPCGRRDDPARTSASSPCCARWGSAPLHIPVRVDADR